MGMDVSGHNPTAKVGEYFHSNICWWHPLASYIQEMHPDLASECKHWHTNDYDGLSSESAAVLGSRLLADIAEGKVAAYGEIHKHVGRADTLESQIAASIAEHFDGKVLKPGSDYRFSVDNVREFAEFCKASGGFHIA
jgi:hypothetical protein